MMVTISRHEGEESHQNLLGFYLAASAYLFYTVFHHLLVRS